MNDIVYPDKGHKKADETARRRALSAIADLSNDLTLIRQREELRQMGMRPATPEEANGRGYPPVTDHDPREDKLPAWARESLGGLRSSLSAEQARVRELEQQVELLKGLAAEKQNGHAYSDTVLVLDDEDATEVPLGDGREIRFSDFYSVRFGAHDDTANVRVLVITTDAKMTIRPTNFSQEIIIARA